MIKRALKDTLFVFAFAVYWEFISTEFWIYDARISRPSFFGGFPLLMILFWLIVFFASLGLSENLYKSVFKRNVIPVFDKALYIFDIITFGVIGTVFEAVLSGLGLVSYSPDLYWTTVPLIHLPINAIAGYFGIGMFVPPTLRSFRNR